MEGVNVEVDMRPRINIRKGMYKSVVSDVTEKEITAKDGSKPKYVVVHFKLNDPQLPKEAQGYELEHSVPGRATANSKLSAILLAAGVKLGGLDKLDVKQALVGKKAELMIANRTFTGRDGKLVEIPDIKNIDWIQ
jgi:hypothetical protein